MRVLNVGGGPTRSLPEKYNGWDQDLLDIDPQVKPDICCDAKELATLSGNVYDAVYCSHNLEHFYKHEVPVVLNGFLHVLKPGGFADISVPNFDGLLKAIQEKNLDISDVWYRTTNGVPITFHDVIFGWGYMVSNGNKYYEHKTAFTPVSLSKELENSNFKNIEIKFDGANLFAMAFKQE